MHFRISQQDSCQYMLRSLKLPDETILDETERLHDDTLHDETCLLLAQGSPDSVQ